MPSPDKYNNIYWAPVKFAVQPDCRPPARYFSGDTIVNPGGLQYSTSVNPHKIEEEKWHGKLDVHDDD